MAPFVRRERKHKRLSRRRDTEPADSNQQEVIPLAKGEKDARREALKAELRAQQPPSKFSSQKQKRLDKYVDTKLRKEENAELIRKLSVSKIDTTLLRSSRNLGRVRESKREMLSRALAERDAFGSDDEAVKADESLLFEPRVIREDAEIPKPALRPQIQDGAPRSFGSGLKRPIDGSESVQPIIKRRKRKQERAQDEGIRSKAPGPNGHITDDVKDEEWQGFSDDDMSESSMGGDLSSGEDSKDDSDSESESIRSDTSSDAEGSTEAKPARISAFKIWADSQRNEAIGFTPSTTLTSVVDSGVTAVKANLKLRAPSPDPLLDTISTSVDAGPAPPATAITITRQDEIQQARSNLPVVQEEQKIMETINANPITIICGATGSGKTTQVPQMLFENGYGSFVGQTPTSENAGLRSQRMIGITQPRRVAATSVANRVAYELGPGHRNRVAHQVRYDTNVSKDTAIKFMTDGILLREIQNDFALSKYGCIIIDEAHERSVNTDILIGMLSRIVPLRAELAVEEPDKFCPLKLVIMSATLRVQDFAKNERLFKSLTPPIVEVGGRQFSVVEHFARRTRRDYIAETVDKVAKAHRKLPAGGILVFLTGQQEIMIVISQLRERLEGFKAPWKPNGRNRRTIDDYEDDAAPVIDEGDFIEGESDDVDGDSETEIDTGADGTDEFAIQDDSIGIISGPRTALKPFILPLYAALPPSQQQMIFQPPPEGHRLIIVATNVAETSLTIPGIRYVFDSGRSKEKRYDQRSGVQTYEVDWISKASATQRKGRAGRTGPGGHVWRLYSSAVYERYFEEHTVPEVLRTPLESVVLQLKGMEIENVANFPFPTPPSSQQLLDAEVILKNLGAIGIDSITTIGKEMMKYPINPRFGKMLMLARMNGITPYAIALVAGLAVGDLFIPQMLPTDVDAADAGDEINMTEVNEQRQAYGRSQAKLSQWADDSDAIKVLTAVALHAEVQGKGTQECNKLCKENWLRENSMAEVQQLRQQLHSIVSTQNSAESKSLPQNLPPPTGDALGKLKQVVAAGFMDQIAIRADLLQDESGAFGRKPKRAIEVAYKTLVPTVSDADIDRNADPVDQAIQRSVFVHPSSVLARLSVKEMPAYLVYSHLSRAPATAVGGKIKKTRMHALTAIKPRALAVLAEGSPLLHYGKPIMKIEELPGRRRQNWVPVSLRAPDTVGNEWPLTEWKVIQKRSSKGEWLLEKVVAR